MSTSLWVTLGAIGAVATVISFLFALAAERRRPRDQRHAKARVFVHLPEGTSVRIGSLSAEITKRELENKALVILKRIDELFESEVKH